MIGRQSQSNYQGMSGPSSTVTNSSVIKAIKSNSQHQGSQPNASGISEQSQFPRQIVNAAAPQGNMNAIVLSN